MFDARFAVLDREMTVQEFYRILAPPVAAVGCVLDPVPGSVPKAYHDSLIHEGVIPVKDLELKLPDQGIALMRIRTFV